MRISGKKIEGANVEVIVLPRGNGSDDIVLKAQAILDDSGFRQLCPDPKPPAVIRKGGEKSFNVEDPGYLAALSEHGQRHGAWIVITSLRLGTPDLEWDSVDFGDPNTWVNYISELRESGFSEVEIVHVVQGCMIANALDDRALEAARNRFLASRDQREGR